MPEPFGGVSWFWRLTFAPSFRRSCYFVFLKSFQVVRGMYGSFFVKTAQTIRAVLFAMATVAKRAGLRSKRAVSHLFARSGWDFVCLTGFVAQIGLRLSSPFPQTGLAYRLCDRYAKSGVAIEDGDADLDFCDLSFEVPRHKRLAQ
jgi:hypothetical protein